MATAEEILAAAFESEAITVNVETRELIIPSTLNSIGVESDDDVFRVPFILPRYYGGLDLAEFDININYRNAQGQGDVYDVTNAVISTDKIEFSWLVGRYAASYAGEVTFNVCLKKYNTDDVSIVDKEWNSIPASVMVNRGLETTGAVVEENPEVIAKLCEYINDLSTRTNRLERQAGFGDGYGVAKIEFVDGVLIISPDDSGSGGSGSGGSSEGGTGGGTEEPEEPDEVVSYNLFGKWVLNKSISFPEVSISLTNTSMKTGANFGISVTKIAASAGSGVSYVMSGSKKTVASPSGVWTEDGYRYIDFGADSVKVDELFYNWFVENAVEHVDETVGEAYRLYVTGGYGVSIYTNGSDNTPLHVSADAVECRGVYKFKFASDNVDAYFKAGDLDDNGEIISIATDNNGWYILTQDTTVVVTAGGENSRRVNNYLTNATTNNLAKSVMLEAPYKAHISPNSGCYIDVVTIIMDGVDVTNDVYSNGDINIPSVTGDISITITAVAFIGNKYQLDIISPVASFAYINFDEATPIAINNGTTTLHGVAKIKFAGVNISGARFFVFSNGEAVYIDIKADANGWYTLTKDVNVTLEGRSNIDPNANILYGKWTFNETINLPEKQVTLIGEEIYTGSGYGVIVTAIAAQAGTGMVYGSSDNNISVQVVDSEGHWIDQRYRSVDFGNLGEVMGDEFYKWFITNATEGGQEFVTVTHTLTNCTLNNADKFTIKGEPYNAILMAPNDGKDYEFGSIQIIMNGVNVTASSYSAGIISIPEVTGDIEISARYKVVYRLSGKWFLNEAIDASNGITLNDEGFSAKTGSDYSIQITAIILWMTGGYYWIDEVNTKVATATTTPYIKFNNKVWRYLDFGETGYAVDETTYKWFLVNGVKQ